MVEMGFLPALQTSRNLCLWLSCGEHESNVTLQTCLSNCLGGKAPRSLASELHHSFSCRYLYFQTFKD